jgi:hypothetical protein
MTLKLKSLFSSSIKSDVLSLLFNNPDKQFYFRVIANLFRKKLFGMKKELDNLEKMDIAKVERKGHVNFRKNINREKACLNRQAVHKFSHASKSVSAG